MSKRPVDVDVKQSIRDIFLSKNEYRLVDDYVIKDGKKHPFALLVPGGGYFMVSSFIEGVPIAKLLNEKGISAFILYYRVRKKAKYPAPMDDLAKAVTHILKHAEEYQVETKNYSIWGASAGAHLAGSFGTENMGYRKYGLPAPDTLILAYPVISMDRSITHMGSHDNLLGKDADKEAEEMASIEKHIDANYPKTYIWCSESDAVVPYANSLRMIEELKKNNVPVESLICRNVDHGVGPATGTEAQGWIDKAVEFWLKEERE